MCGFAGFWSAGETSSLEERGQTALRMAAAVARRGPDDETLWIDESSPLTLGHRRLAIVDISREGRQPMHSASGRFVIAYNGEIYNFPDLRSELERAGAPAFRGHSDTEVLLAAIERWGLDDALTRVNGMFAFSLWDRRDRVLALAVDRMGEKPLYYGWQGGTFLFGSDLAALRCHPSFDGRLSRRAISLLLNRAYIPAPLTVFEGISKLTPGSALLLPERALRARECDTPRRYWDLLNVARTGLAATTSRPEAEAMATVETLLARATQRQLVADVPLGAFLSGGVDSSAIVALAQSLSTSKLKTFTLGFDDPRFDEAPAARAVASHLGTDHTEMYVTDEDARDLIPSLPDAWSEPFADASQIPTALVARLARKRVTVALSGDGGDEVFGGYNRYLIAERLWRMSRTMPQSMRRVFASACHVLSPQAIDRINGVVSSWLPPAWRFRGAGEKVHTVAGAMAARSDHAFYDGLSGFWPIDSGVVMGDAGAADSEGVWPPPNDIAEFVPWMMAQDTIGYLPGDILVKVDRAAMFSSLETRLPYLDREVVEFAWTLPQSLKFRGGVGKWCLRQILSKHVPAELIDRPKTGFGVPIHQWLRGPLKAWSSDLLSPDRLRRGGLFSPALIERCWREHLSGRFNRQGLLWPVLMFEQWREHVTPGTGGPS